MIPSRRSSTHVAFTARVDEWTAAAMGEGVATFSGLLQRLPGVYPVELLASVDRLAGSRTIDPAAADSIRQQASANRAGVVEGRSLLPLPHPLDYEWRFTPDSSRSLLDRAASLTRAGDDLLLFGTPGLAVEALTLPIGRRLAFLAESNSVTGRVIALNHAIGAPISIAFCNNGLPRESGEAVLLDPPWYLDYVRPMLAAAAHACRPGGVVLISLPPDGARPSAVDDRRAVVAFAERLGLAMIEHLPLAIGYETPFFERNALAAAGISPPPQWRRGDLVVFRKVRPSRRPPIASSSRRRDWTEVGVGRMRLFIRGVGEARSEEASFASLIGGDVLPTVSRRDPRRQLANIWTSGNRIFRTNNAQLVLEAAISCAGTEIGSGIQPRLWGTVRQSQTLERLAAELRTLAAIEEREEGQAPILPTERSLSWKLGSTKSSSTSEATTSG